MNACPDTNRPYTHYAFAGPPDCGNLSDAPLVADSTGNLYGTTEDGPALGEGEAQQFSFEWDGGGVVSRKIADPVRPCVGDNASLRSSVVDPSEGGLFAEEDGIGVERRWVQLQFEEAGGQTFADRFVGDETEEVSVSYVVGG